MQDYGGERVMINDGQIGTTTTTGAAVALDSPTLHLRSIKAQDKPTVFFIIFCAGSHSRLIGRRKHKSEEWPESRQTPHFKEQIKDFLFFLNLQNGLLFHAVMMRQERVGRRSQRALDAGYHLNADSFGCCNEINDIISEIKFKTRE